MEMLSNITRIMDWEAEGATSPATRRAVGPGNISEVEQQLRLMGAATPSALNVLSPAVLTAWHDISSAGLSIRGYGALLRVATLADGWRGPSSRSLRSGSLKQFLRFWERVNDEAVEPELSLANDGTLHAEWYKSDKERLDLRFGDKSIFFGLLTKDSVHEGADQLDAVVNVLTSHRAKPLLWKAE